MGVGFSLFSFEVIRSSCIGFSISENDEAGGVGLLSQLDIVVRVPVGQI